MANEETFDERFGKEWDEEEAEKFNKYLRKKGIKTDGRIK